jgi:CTP:molybdopterin cytidylyltransferase MocA
VPYFNGQQGVPAIFTRRFYDDIMTIRGDVGARRIIRRNPQHVLMV